MGMESFYVRLQVDCPQQELIATLRSIDTIKPYYEYKSKKFFRHKAVVNNQFIIKNFIKADFNEQQCVCLEACFCNFFQYINDIYWIYNRLNHVHFVVLQLGEYSYQNITYSDFENHIRQYYAIKYSDFLSKYGTNIWNSLPGAYFYSSLKKIK